jgi:hypothetical protein
MKPYEGTEVWMYFVLVACVITALSLLVLAFKTEKREKAEDDALIAKSIRQRKYLFFAGFALALVAAINVGIFAEPISLENHRKAMVKTIEANNVKVVEGFVDPSIPLRPESHSKFVVETDSGVIRCRATATDANTDVQFMCQDFNDKERDFTIPLSKVNDLEIPKAETDDAKSEVDAKK